MLKSKQLLTYMQISSGKGKVISHITRVNSVSSSSKMIVPKRVIEALSLDWKNDYIEWTIEMRGGKKVAAVRKFRADKYIRMS